MDRRRRRYILLAVLALALPWGIYGLLFGLTVPENSPESHQWLLPALSLALVVLTLGLAGVLIRNLVKLIVERRRGILGSRLRIKLVFFFLALVLLPAIVLFSGSAHIIKHTVEAILRTPSDLLRHGDDIVARWREHLRAECRQRTAVLAEEIVEGHLLDPARSAELTALLARCVQQEGLSLARVAVGGRIVASTAPAVGSAERAELERLVDESLAASARDGGEHDRFDRLGQGLVALAARPLGEPRARAVLVVARTVPAELVLSLKTIDTAVAEYEQLRYKRRDLVRLYVTLIGLIFVATLFVATWIGWYVARRITEPLHEVAAAAREISAGHMDVRVRTRVGDEMAMLVDAFNEMAGQLEENREVITRSTAELRRSNQALDERRRYIETLVANLSTAVLSLDPAGRVTTANPAVERILGLRVAPGDDLVAQLSQAGLTTLAELLRPAAGPDRAGVRRDLELPPTAPTQHVSVQLAALRGRSEEELGRLVMVEDLSDLLRAQKALAWQDVARRLAHEIKNPLTPIQLSAQRLRKKFDARAEDLGEVLLEATASIEREVTGLKQLLDEFSRFARMPQVEPRPVELSQVVESVLALYKGVSGVEWQVELDRRVGAVRVDAEQMRRVLINLIDNALAAMEARGTIRISTRRVGGGGAFRVEVADSGPGIDPADRDRLFAPYFSTKKRGTGLGLAIVHKVVTDHGGTIRVESNAPRGARFVIEVPTGRRGPIEEVGA